jgi:hypothetical protein
LNGHITILFHIPSKKSTTNSPSAIYLNDLLHLAKFGKGKKKNRHYCVAADGRR